MQTTIRLTEELHSQVKKVAKEKGISINAVVTLALWEYLKFTVEKKEGWERMDKSKVDKTIENICDWIQKELEKADIAEVHEITNMTCALAELVSARAKHN